MAVRILIHSWRDLGHPEAGGAEHYIVTVAEGLAARGHEVTIRTAAYPGAPSRETHAGVRYLRRGGRLTIYPTALVSQLADRRRYDVVIDIQNGMPYLSPLVRRGRVVNLVHHVHREQWPYLFGPRLAAVGWFLESRVATSVYRGSRYVAVSPSTQRELGRLGVDVESVEVIHNGTDPWSAAPVPRSPTPRLVVLGRLVPQKRVEFAIEATASLSHDFPSIELDIVGSGWWEDTLREHAQHLGVQERVHFHGHVSDTEKHELLGRAWIHLLPSVKEGWGLVIAEAGLHATPTVAFREAGGPSDSIIDGETGVLVEGDQGASLTSATRRLLAEDQVRTDMGKAAQEWVREFHWERTVDLWDRVVRGAVSDPQEWAEGQL